MSLTRRELVCEAIAHHDTGRIPYAIMFTSEARAKLTDYFGTDDLDEYIGNCIRPARAPWWQFTNVPEDQLGSEVPSRLPDIGGTGSYTDFYDDIARLRETTDCFILALFWASLFEKAWILRGMENLMMDMILHPDYCEALFDRIVEADLMMLEMMLSADVDGVLLGSDWGGQAALLMNPEQWRCYFGPRQARMFHRIHKAGKYTFLHSCGNIFSILPDVVKMDVQVLNPVQPVMDVEQVKAQFGDALCLWGGISTQRTLPYGSPREVRAETRSVAQILGKGGGYILAPGQDIQEDVPVENCLALIEEAQTLFERA